jgi:dihydrolipoamide dehydrogenase
MTSSSSGQAQALSLSRKKKGKILGCHIIGPSASILIQEVVNAMTRGETAFPVFNGIHIHPALSEVVHSALGNPEEPS